MSGQYHAVESNGQHNIELQFQNSPSRTPSPPPRRYQGLLARRRPKATQVGYASLGLCYSVEKTEDVALLVAGNVSIADLSTVSTISVVNGSASIFGEEYAVNSYGIISQGLNLGSLADIPWPRTLFYGDNKHFFCDDYCSYVFRETNTATQDDPSAAPISAYTDRKVDIKTQCKAFKVREGGDGTKQSIVIEDGQKTRNITLPSKEGPNYKVYMTSGSQDCGSDCSYVSVFEPSSTDPWFYNCTITMSPVENAKRPEHKVSDRMAHLVTSAIALGGLDGPDNSRTNSYPPASLFGVPLNGSTGVVEYLMSRFSTGALAATIEANTDVVLPGQVPTVGQKLSISHWGVMSLIFLITAVIQLAVAIVAAKVSGRVVVPPSDTLSEAKVLRAMVEEDLLDEEPKDPAATEKGKSLWIYRSAHVGDGIYDLYMEEVKT
ncbi:hypothetical protein NW768_010002 [Fusarium equiseti]|uniref:Uncharacterized protein n=1 Tax=Fusarium equiseti TaxID=61235 RepID=A0ABQ8R1H3_FUSEQ|nr:hypothetical protein NW768_010002 [Fusarium equiseti]